MKTTTAVVALMLACMFATPAAARHHHHKHHHYYKHHHHHLVHHAKRHYRHRIHRDASATRFAFNDPRPHAWCGWWMRHHLGVADRSGNLARWWAGFGTNAGGPAVGAIVVWRHHVAIITGHSESGWIMKSGNDGHAVRERVRSVRGAIAFRWPNRMARL